MDAVNIIGILILCFCFIMIKKNNRTCEMRNLVANAIYAYNVEQIENGCYEEMLYFECEPYEKTLWRLNDWGYTNIAPPDVLEKIQPYIKEQLK